MLSEAPAEFGADAALEIELWEVGLVGSAQTVACKSWVTDLPGLLHLLEHLGHGGDWNLLGWAREVRETDGGQDDGERGSSLTIGLAAPRRLGELVSRPPALAPVSLLHAPGDR